MLLLKYNIIKKRQMNKLFLKPKFNISDNKEYKIEIIRESVIYAKK